MTGLNAKALRMLRFGAMALLIGVVPAIVPTAGAQSFPEKPVRLLVQFPPGGLVDTFARSIQPKMSESLGQQVIVENRPGAGGTIAEAAIAKSAPDGYMVLFAGDAVTANPHLYGSLSHDLFRDFVPVSLVARVPLVLVVPGSLPPNTLQEYVAYVRARPGQMSYASPGSGVSHFAAEIFKSQARIDLMHVPYKGGGPAMVDLVSGQVHALFTSVFAVAPQVKAGKMKALAIGSDRRSPLLPQTPTFAESGFPDFTAASWAGILAPAGTPQPVIQRLNAEAVRAVRSPEVEARLQELGAEAVGSSPAEFAALLKRDYETFGKLIRELKISGN
jgi:tripartite-type tricarboxylate transporter receptor subunit TctC